MRAAIISEATAKSDKKDIANDKDKNPGLLKNNKECEPKFVSLYSYTLFTI